MELVLIGRDWDVGRNETRAVTKSQLYERCMRWGYLGASDQAQNIQVAGGLESTVSRTNSLMRRAQEPAGNEIFPIGDRNTEPTPAIERQDERREDNVTPEAVHGNIASVSKPPPPATQVRDSRPETPGRVQDNQRGRRAETQEDSRTDTRKEAGKDAKGRQKGEGKETGIDQSPARPICPIMEKERD